MNTDLILQLVELAISMAQSQLDGGELKETLADVILKGVRAYEEHTGETLAPLFIKAEEPI
jgi:hypothetical protein